MFGLLGKKSNKDDDRKDGKKGKEKERDEWTELMYMDALLSDDEEDE